MLKYFKKAFQITNENIILTTPLVLFLFLLSIYLGVAKSAPATIQSAILLLVTILFMISAFLAGWFYMVKKAIELDKNELVEDEEKSRASFDLMKEIPTGVGEYFLSFVGVSVFYSVLILLFVWLTYQVGMHFIGDIGISLDAAKDALASSEALKKMLVSLTHEQLLRFNAWNILILAVMTFYSFITMFWAAQVVMKTKNPILAFFQSVAVIFKKPLGSILLFVYISFVNFVVSLINTFSNIHPIAYFLSMLIYFYFLVYVVVLVFLYYDREIKDKDETIEQTEDNSDSGSDSVGQD